MTNELVKEVHSCDKYLLTRQDKVIIHGFCDNMAQYLYPYVKSINSESCEETIHVVSGDYNELHDIINDIKKKPYRRILKMSQSDNWAKCFIFKTDHDFIGHLKSVGRQLFTFETKYDFSGYHKTIVRAKTITQHDFETFRIVLTNDLKAIFPSTFIGFNFDILNEVISIMKYPDLVNFISDIITLYESKYYVGILKLITAKYYNGMIFRATFLINGIIKQSFDTVINKVEQTWGKIDNIDDPSLKFLEKFINCLEILKTSSHNQNDVIRDLGRCIEGYPEPLAYKYFSDKLRSICNQEEPDYF